MKLERSIKEKAVMKKRREKLKRTLHAFISMGYMNSQTNQTSMWFWCQACEKCEHANCAYVLSRQASARTPIDEPEEESTRQNKGEHANCAYVLSRQASARTPIDEPEEESTRQNKVKNGRNLESFVRESSKLVA
ncbi:hypothetical protein QE152_g35810 [Popillia japonica]|uniref:Uncharacterized protein n=1 Tax=Popillia japonica TaxID=7064 RepID=A0AAW1IF68_POPJA